MPTAGEPADFSGDASIVAPSGGTAAGKLVAFGAGYAVAREAKLEGEAVEVRFAGAVWALKADDVSFTPGAKVWVDASTGKATNSSDGNDQVGGFVVRTASLADAAVLLHLDGPNEFDAGGIELAKLTISRETPYAGTGSFQPVEADLEIDEDAGAAEAPDTAFLAPMMGNLIGDAPSGEGNYQAGVIGANSVTGANDTVMPTAAVMGIAMDGVTDLDAIVLAVIDGSDPSSVTGAKAAFGVRKLNDDAASQVEYGLDLRDDAVAVDDWYSDGSTAFVPSKAEVRLSSGICILTGAGAPVDGTTGDNFAAKGSLYVNETDGGWWKNTGTITDSVWVELAEVP